MKKFLVVLFAISLVFVFFSVSTATLITSPSDTSLTGATVIDFEGQALGTDTSLTISDVTFIAGNNFLRVDDYLNTLNVTGKYLENTLTGSNNITFSFSSTVNAFGFNWGASNEDWLLTAYDGSDNPIESYSLPQTWLSNSGDFYGIDADNIAYATLIQTTTGYGSIDWILIDNFAYGSGNNDAITSYSNVPEPTTMLLLGTGLVGLAGFGRKKFKK